MCEVILDNAQESAKYIFPAIQKEILNIFAVKVREKIRKDIGNVKFCILVDESKDNSGIEQMAAVVWYVDKEGNVKERIFDVQRVDNVCFLTLNNGIMNVLTRFDLQVQNLRGQGYDGANNAWGATNGLQALFLKECPYAYYVHCFAHRLQLALEKAAKNYGPSPLHPGAQVIFNPPKRKTRQKKILNGDVETGKGANHVGTLRGASDTRWISDYNSACTLIRLFDPTCLLIKKLGTCESSDDYSVGEAQDTDEKIKSFKFIFVLLLMHKIMGITDTLCQGLQLKSQDIVNAINLVSTTKTLLQRLRDDVWKKKLESIELFCEKH
ncbi:zinc finger MYM-type protein 1-like [Papaver somniferum]|uniref:zinc finger MYM-type protein 1-like n=1 Tax=Papaver somniferum TaxID=3469 RepID=UPI000E7037B3|nr:zinc finger MYM-type protein 1-like [Papaver somniferum]